MRFRRTMAAWPAVPADNASVVLFSTHPRAPGGAGTIVRGMIGYGGTKLAIDSRSIVAVHVTFLKHNKASAANGIRVYARIPSDGTFTETDLNDGANPPNATIGTAANYQVPILAAGRTTHLTLLVSHLFAGFSIEYTAGADNPEQWDGMIVLECDNSAVMQ